MAEAPERVSTYMTLLTYARRFRNAIVMALHSPEAEALRAARPALDAALDDLGVAARDLRPPAPLPHLPDSGPAMTRIARQLQVLHSAVDRLASGDSAPGRQ